MVSPSPYGLLTKNAMSVYASGDPQELPCEHIAFGCEPYCQRQGTAEQQDCKTLQFVHCQTSFGWFLADLAPTLDERYQPKFYLGRPFAAPLGAAPFLLSSAFPSRMRV
jgi:hypothetical protein